MKKIIRLTESDLHRIVKESTRKVIREMDFDTPRARSFLRQAVGNRIKKYYDERKKGDKADPKLLNGLHKSLGDVSRYAHNSKNKDTRSMSLPHPWCLVDGIRGAGNSGLNANRSYNVFQSTPWENIAEEMFGEAVADKLIDWAEGVDFDPVQYAMMYDPDGEVESDIDASDAFEYELDKLDNCPVLTPEQISAYKQRLRVEIEDSEFEDNWGFNPPDPPEPIYERD